MKRTALALTLVLALFSVMFGVKVVKIAKASYPISTGIKIISPTNTTYSPRLLILNASFRAMVGRNINYSMAYSLDGRENVTIPIVIQGKEMSFRATISGFVTLPKLSEGPHSVTVYSEIDLYNVGIGGIYYPKYVVLEHNTVCFTIDDGYPTVISNLSLENKTYSQNDLSLNFTTDQPTSWIGYCLDGKTNMTIAGNTTLMGLSDGEHNVTVYAKDNAGNMGTSETIYFNIAEKLEPEPFPTTLVIAVVATVAAIGVGLLVYFKKRRS